MEIIQNIFVTPDSKMIARMIHLPPERNQLLSEHDIQSVKVYIAESKINNKNEKKGNDYMVCSISYDLFSSYIFAILINYLMCTFFSAKLPFL